MTTHSLFCESAVRFRAEALTSVPPLRVAMSFYRGFSEPPGYRKVVLFPPGLDMGSVKADDLRFDLEAEVARLRAAEGEPGR